MQHKEKTKPSNWIGDYADALFRHAIVRVGDRETAKDLVQDTFLIGAPGHWVIQGRQLRKNMALFDNEEQDHRPLSQEGDR